VLPVELRIGVELTAAQARGEVATQAHGPVIRDHVRSADKMPATLPDLGIPRQRAADMEFLLKPDPTNSEVQPTVPLGVMLGDVARVKPH
jgi:hypothetical protein